MHSSSRLKRKSVKYLANIVDPATRHMSEVTHRQTDTHVRTLMDWRPANTTTTISALSLTLTIVAQLWTALYIIWPPIKTFLSGKNLAIIDRGVPLVITQTPKILMILTPWTIFLLLNKVDSNIERMRSDK